MLKEIIINGLINGSIYALLAIGFSLIFGVARIINIAHTGFYMLSAYFIYTSLHYLGMLPLIAIFLSIIITTLIGLGCYRVLIDPLREHEAAVLIATIALAIIFQEVILLFFGANYLAIPPLVPGYTKIVGIKVTYQHLVAIAVALLVLGGTWLLLMKTKVGLAIRTTAQDREVANLLGMNVTKVAMVTMAISVILAATAGVIVAPLFVLDPQMWMHPLVIILGVVVMGGMGSIKGSFFGAYILALAEAAVVFLIPMGSFLKGSVALSIMILVLCIRPEGLFGVVFEEER